jgi:hypothetical protein
MYGTRPSAELVAAQREKKNWNIPTLDAGTEPHQTNPPSRL